MYHTLATVCMTDYNLGRNIFRRKVIIAIKHGTVYTSCPTSCRRMYT